MYNDTCKYLHLSQNNNNSSNKQVQGGLQGWSAVL